MKLEDQVVALELAKRLKKLGVKQESYFYWSTPWPRGSKWIDENNSDFRIVEASNPDSYAAFTVAALLSRFKNCDVQRTELEGNIRWTLYRWKDLDHRFWVDGSDADSLAGLTIYLIENKLMEAKQ